MLSTWSTPGVALTYFSMRQVIVFSTSFGPRPGRQRADDEHRRRQLGERVDRHARRDDRREDDQRDRRASGSRSGCAARARSSRASLRGLVAPASTLVAVVQERAPFGDDVRARRRARGSRKSCPPISPSTRDRRARARRRPRRRTRVAFVAAHRGGAERDLAWRARARRRRCASSAVVPTGIARVGVGTSISKCTVRVARVGAGARREIGRRRASCPVDEHVTFTVVPGATTSKSTSGASAATRTDACDRRATASRCRAARTRRGRS